MKRGEFNPHPCAAGCGTTIQTGTARCCSALCRMRLARAEGRVDDARPRTGARNGRNAGVWLTYRPPAAPTANPDAVLAHHFASLRAHRTELDGLRYAHQHGLALIHLPWHERPAPVGEPDVTESDAPEWTL